MNHEPQSTVATSVTKICFRFEHGDWCNFIVDEQAGHFVVDGHTFQGSYSWAIGSNLGIEPPYTLLRGLDGFGIDYLADKLSYGGGRTVYDPEATEAAVRAVVAEAMEKLDPREAEVESIISEETMRSIDYTSCDSFLYTAPRLLEEPHLFIKNNPSRGYTMLRKRYLPAFKAWAREQVG